MYQSIANNIIRYFHYERDRLFILVDEAYVEIAQSIKQLYKRTEIRAFQTDEPEHIKQVLDLPSEVLVLLLAEPETYVKYKLFQYFDFSDGEPQISGTMSRVLIFPAESICRIFSGDVRKHIAQKERLLNTMKEYQKYRITTEQGTDLFFEARSWISLDFEICTAPVENSINGKIVVDGAVCFRKNDHENAEKIILEIEQGNVKNIEAYDDNGKQLKAEYLKMISKSVENPKNRQLAEIGIGFCHGALISDCFMEAETVINTCHFCFGNNICYGGENTSEFHGNSVLIRNPMFVEVS